MSEQMMTPLDPEQIAVIPGLGTVVDLDVPVEVARAIVDIDELTRRLRQAKDRLSEILAQESLRVGSRTLHVEGLKVTVTPRQDTVWDLDLLRQGLIAAGCPDDRITALVRQTVEEKVDGTVARQLATNPEYAAVIASSRTVTDRPTGVKVEAE